MPLISRPRFFKGRVSSRALSCLIGLLVLASASFAATPSVPEISPRQIAFYKSSTESNRVKFLIELAKSGQQELAAELLRRVPLEGPHAQNRTLFIEGLILEARKNYSGAAKKFRIALANDPKLTLVRAELAQVLMMLDERDSARHHLRLLEADAPSEAEAKNIKSFIDKIDQSRPYSVSGYLSLAPSTNINSGSSHNTVYSPVFNSDLTVSAASKAQSGLGAAAGLSAGYSKRLGNRIQAVVAGNIDGRIYGDSSFDSASTSESAELRYLLENGYLSGGAVASQGIDPYGHAITYSSYGPRVALNYQLTPRNLLKTSAVYENRDYINSPVQNGMALLTDAALTHAFDSTMNVTAFGGYQSIGAQLASMSYQTFFGGLNFYKELSMGVTIDISGQARISGFGDIDPIAGVLRQDDRFTASATLTKRDVDFLGFAPSVGYTYTLNKSNIAIFDYDSHAVNFNLTKEF